MRTPFYLLVVALLLQCQTPRPSSRATSLLYQGQQLPQEQVLQTIAFGSCNRQDLDQEMWPAIAQNQPQLWIWLGDNIYADTEDMTKMAQMWQQQKFAPAYAAFRQKTPVIGTWDDHDYGVNDGNKSYPQKVASQQLLLDFLDVAPENPARSRPGVYQAYSFGPPGQQVKIILLDARYFSDALQSNPARNPRYLVNPTGDLLGEAQWRWLEKELRNSTAQVHLIGSGIQILPAEQGFEKWANFPQARQRLLELLAKHRPARPILLSGDRHIAEVSAFPLPGLEVPLYEVTSSGLTHAYTGAGDEPNRYRRGKIINQRNFAILHLDWSTDTPKLRVDIKGLGNTLLQSTPLN